MTGPSESFALTYVSGLLRFSHFSPYGLYMCTLTSLPIGAGWFWACYQCPSPWLRPYHPLPPPPSHHAVVSVECSRSISLQSPPPPSSCTNTLSTYSFILFCRPSFALQLHQMRLYTIYYKLVRHWQTMHTPTTPST